MQTPASAPTIIPPDEPELSWAEFRDLAGELD